MGSGRPSVVDQAGRVAQEAVHRIEETSVAPAQRPSHSSKTRPRADDPLPPKPAPDLFVEAARRMQVPPEKCQVFEDGDAGLEAARRAGMLATNVRPFTGQ